MHSRKALLTIVVVGAGSGCSYHARAPEQYRDDTVQLLETQKSAIKQCYDDILKRDSQVSGNVAIKFVVAAETGQIVGPAVDATRTTAPEPLSQCVLRAIAGLKLAPADAREGHASFVYEFRPNPQS